MNEGVRYSVASEAEIGYETAVNEYLLSRFETITTQLNPSDSVRSPQMRFGEIKDFAVAVAKTAPLYLIEQFAPNAVSYSSLRGAGYSEMSHALAGKTIFNRGATEAVKLNHEFRASANALDAVVDESDDVLTRNDIRNSPQAEGFRRSKSLFYERLKKAAKVRQGRDLTPFGNTARRYQMHEDLYLDLARMKKSGIESTKFLKHLPEPPEDFLFSREQLGFLIVLGIDGETLLIDSVVPVTPDLSLNSEARDAAFWGAIMGTLGDQWADVLQDFCSNSGNMFISLLDQFPEEKKRALQSLSTFIPEGRELLQKPTAVNKLRFLKLQIKSHQKLREVVPEIVETYGQLIAKAFHEIPTKYRSALIPIRFGSWDLVSLYQFSDFLLHIDKYEDEARIYTQRQLKPRISQA